MEIKLAVTLGEGGMETGLVAYTDFVRHTDCPNETEGREFIRTPGSKGDV